MVVKYIRDAVFSGTCYHLWYLPSLVFALLVVYFLCRYLDAKKAFITAFGLYLIAFLVILILSGSVIFKKLQIFISLFLLPQGTKCFLV